MIVFDYVDINLENKKKAIAKYAERYERVKHIMSGDDLDLCDGIDCELELKPKGEWMTAKHKLLRKYERILGISAKGNKSDKRRG